MKTDIKLNNLRRWVRSGAARSWVDRHDANWNHADWLSLISELEKSNFWPLPLADVGASLESVRQKYLTEKQRFISLTSSTGFASGLIWYLSGLALVGLAAGFFSGSSYTPVVGVLLPLLFGLVGGVGGLYLANVSLDSISGLQRVNLLGQALCGFCLASMAGAGVGIVLRLTSPFVFAPQTFAQAVPLRPDDAMEVLALDKRLKILGISPKESTNILGRTVQKLADADRPIGIDRIQLILSQAKNVAETLKTTIPESEKKVNFADFDVQGSHESLSRLPGDLAVFINQLELWADPSKPQPEIPRALYNSYADNVYSRLQTLLTEYDNNATPTLRGTMVSTIRPLYLSLYEEWEKAQFPSWKLGPDGLAKFISSKSEISSVGEIKILTLLQKPDEKSIN